MQRGNSVDKESASHNITVFNQNKLKSESYRFTEKKYKAEFEGIKLGAKTLQWPSCKRVYRRRRRCFMHACNKLRK